MAVVIKEQDDGVKAWGGRLRVAFTGLLFGIGLGKGLLMAVVIKEQDDGVKAWGG